MSNGNGQAVLLDASGRRTIREALRYAARKCRDGDGESQTVSLADERELKKAGLVWREIYGEYPKVVYLSQPDCRHEGAYVVILKRQA